MIVKSTAVNAGPKAKAERIAEAAELWLEELEALLLVLEELADKDEPLVVLLVVPFEELFALPGGVKGDA